VHQQPAAWLRAAAQQAEPIFARAKTILRDAGVPAAAVETEIVAPVSGEAIVTDILEVARTRQCGTVVVGREAFHGLQALFTHHIGDALVRQGQGLSIWVTE
jgi:nucleotide-binding universal stress UspA family protein